MWKHREYLTLILKTDALHLWWFRQQKERALIYYPQEWCTYSLDALQITNRVLFNLTSLSDIIIDFIQQRTLKDVYVSIALAPELIWERCLWIDQEHPNSDHLDHEAQSLIWNYAYITSNSEMVKNLYYLFGIKRQHLFQYQLLALKVPFHCTTITTTTRALLYAAFRLLDCPFKEFNTDHLTALQTHCQNQFDMALCNDLFKAKPLHFNELFNLDKQTIMTSMGLYFLGRDYELS